MRRKSSSILDQGIRKPSTGAAVAEGARAAATPLAPFALKRTSTSVELWSPLLDGQSRATR